MEKGKDARDWLLSQSDKEGLVERARQWPGVYSATQAVRKPFYDAYAWFVAAFREAAKRLRQGDRDTPFPIGSFPPA